MGQHEGIIQRGEIWWTDKTVEGYRLRESCRTTDKREALRYLDHRIAQIRNERIYGIRPEVLFEQASAKYLDENQDKKSIKEDIYHLRLVMPYIGNLPIERVHHQSLQPFIEKRKQEGVKNKTINLTLSVVRRILNLSARLWRHDTGLSYLETAPLIQMLPENDARIAYTLDPGEQREFFQALPPLLGHMALFKVNTGCREQEVCRLQWDWEWETDGELKGRVFIIPGERRKKTQEKMKDKVVVLNDTAKSVIDSMRGIHAKYVFTHKQKIGDVTRRRPMARMNETGWRNAWRKAGLPVSDKYRRGPHNLRNTFATRLRMLGVSEETRAQLLGHTRKSMTTLYSQAGIMELLNAVNLLCSRHNSDTLSIVKLKDYATG